MNLVPRASHSALRSEMKVKRNKRLCLICFKNPSTHKGRTSNSQSEGLIGDKYISYYALELLQPARTQAPIEASIVSSAFTLISINIIKHHPDAACLNCITHWVSPSFYSSVIRSQFKTTSSA